MPNLNKVMIMGNLTRDPELKYTPGGLAVAEFALAINRRRKDKSGEKVEETTFVDCTAFGKQAEVIAEHVSKGQALFVEGRLKQERWDDKQGNKRSKLSVVCDQFEFLTSKGRSTETTSAPPDIPAWSDEQIPF